MIKTFHITLKINSTFGIGLMISVENETVWPDDKLIFYLENDHCIHITKASEHIDNMMNMIILDFPFTENKKVIGIQLHDSVVQCIKKCLDWKQGNIFRYVKVIPTNFMIYTMTNQMPFDLNKIKKALCDVIESNPIVPNIVSILESTMQEELISSVLWKNPTNILPNCHSNEIKIYASLCKYMTVYMLFYHTNYIQNICHQILTFETLTEPIFCPIQLTNTTDVVTLNKCNHKFDKITFQNYLHERMVDNSFVACPICRCKYI